LAQAQSIIGHTGEQVCVVHQTVTTTGEQSCQQELALRKQSLKIIGESHHLRVALCSSNQDICHYAEICLEDGSLGIGLFFMALKLPTS
jgi:hypothetical protein